MHKVCDRRRQRGFTLLEIMLVVTIIGLLATVAIVKLTRTVGPAKIATTETTIQNIRTALGIYEQDKGKFPDTLAELINGEKHYLDQEVVPTDAWGHEFRYYLKGDLVKIRSAGPDGEFGTPDDIENK